MESIQQQEMLYMKDIICSNFNPPSPAPPNATSVTGEDFFVDQLLNLNDNEEDEPTIIDSSSAAAVNQFQQHSNKTSFISPPLDSVLSVPADDEADLEWLSHFVEESFSQFSTPYPPGMPKPKPTNELSQGPCKARRTKRARTGGRVWSAALSEPPSPSKNKDNNRRCSHCGVQKTPQWRAGPMGAKTLCNACGVRFKSGRLLPEYRPACSPTFSSQLHSNSHRKVLEMRKKKQISGSFPPSVSSFG